MIHSTHREIFAVSISHFKRLLGSDTSVQLFPEDISLSVLHSDADTNLVKPFTTADILIVLKSMANGKCPGPDGFTPEFFILSWSVVGRDVTTTVLHFFDNLQLPRIVNSSAIALVPKVANPSHLSQYRPISCCNTLYKCIAKLLVARMKLIMSSIISICQAAFIPGKNIGDNILLIHSI